MCGQLTENYHIPKTKVRKAYSGVHPHEIITHKRDFQRDYSAQPVRLLFVGALVLEKGVITLLDTANILCERRIPFTLRVVGAGQDRGFVTDKLRAIKPREKIIFHGSIPHEAVIGYYKDADIFLYPSREESFGLVVAEAMATGLPVISSKAGAIPEVVEDGKTGILVEPEEPGRFADAVEFLISHPDTMRQMGMQGIRRVNERFTWEKTAERLEQIYFECLKQ